MCAALMRRHIFRRGMSAVLAFAVLAGGCTTLQAVDLPPDRLRDALRGGDVAQPGETIVLVTADGAEHTLEFMDVDAAADVVRGRADDGAVVAVAVEDIVVLRSLDRAAGSSTLLTIAVVAAIALGVFVADAGEDFVELLEPLPRRSNSHRQ